MKCKKYVIFLLLVTIAGLNKTYANDNMCFYMSNDFKATLDIRDSSIYIDMVGETPDHDSEDLLNSCGTLFWDNTTEGGYEFETLGGACPFGIGRSLEHCPKYLVVQIGCGPEHYRVWGTESQNEAKNATDTINGVAGCKGKYVSYMDEDGNKITAEKYYSSIVKQDLLGKKIPEGKEACESIFGDKDDEGGVNDDGTKRGPSLRYLIDQVLTYVRIIVPILIILLGSLDFAKAMTSGKEDEMKSSQKKFIMRIVAGIIVFLAPQIVNVIMWLADVAWQGMDYTTCTFN